MSNEIAKSEKNIADNVLNRVNQLSETGGLVIPSTYSAANALKSAWLILKETKDKSGKLALNTCTKESICNALLDMVVQGLSPSKKQCYFVVYGSQLQLMRSYMGTVAVTKRLNGVKNVNAECIYEGDEFQYEINPETGIKRVTKHVQSFSDINLDKLIGAYAIVITDDPAESYTEIMTMDQIRKAWGQGAAKGSSMAHKNFTDEMAKKTVINRACKMFANTSDDSDLLIETFNKTTDNEYPDFSHTRRVDDILDSDEVERIEEFNKSIIDESAQEISQEADEKDSDDTTQPDDIDIPEKGNEADGEPEQIAMEEGAPDEANE